MSSTNAKPCAEFFRRVRTAFGFLQTDYGLSEIEAECRAPECWLSFGSERLVVTVALEMDGEPWVAIDLFEPGPPRSLIIRTSLEFLLEEIGVLGDKDSEGAIRGDVIESKAQSLRKFGHGLLVGDQALVRRLDARGREKRRQRESTLLPPTPRGSLKRLPYRKRGSSIARSPV